MIARGLEFMSPVSLLLVKENVVGRFQLLLNGASQALPEKPIVTVELEVLENVKECRFSPNDQFSVALKSVQMNDIGAISPEHPA